MVNASGWAERVAARGRKSRAERRIRLGVTDPTIYLSGGAFVGFCCFFAVGERGGGFSAGAVGIRAAVLVDGGATEPGGGAGAAVGGGA